MSDEKEEIGKLLDIIETLQKENATKEKKIKEQQEQIDLLEKNREKLNKWLDEYVDKFTEVWRIVEPCRRG